MKKNYEFFFIIFTLFFFRPFEWKRILCEENTSCFCYRSTRIRDKSNKKKTPHTNITGNTTIQDKKKKKNQRLT